MPTHDTIRNDRISEDGYTDLAGDTVNYPYAGQLEVPAEPYLGHQSRNADGTLTAMPSEGSVISTLMVCAVCGVPVKSKAQLTRQRGHWVCKDCIDEPGRGE